MAKVSVSINPEAKLFSEIDLQQAEWSSLLPQNLPSFNMEELKRPCNVYPEGIFPGADNYRDGKQITEIQNFFNYVEFCKVVSDEAIPIGGQLFLSPKFYDRRKVGWASQSTRKKEGEVVAYCVNGDLYCAEDKKRADLIFYGVVYESLIQEDPVLQKLQRILSDGLRLELIGADQEILDQIALLLLKRLEK